MRKLIIGSIIFLLLTSVSFSAPSNTLSIPNSFSPLTSISSSEVNADFNEIQSKYNSHTHTDITSLGTITTGGWAGTPIDEAYGGTGADYSATAQGSIFYFSGTGTVSTLAPSTANYPLVTNGAGANPAYEQLTTVGIADSAITNDKILNGTINLTTKVTGTLPDDNGGTGHTIVNTGSTGAVTAGNSGTFTFGTAFSNTNYIVVCTPIGADTNDNIDHKIHTKAVGSCKVKITTNDALDVNCIAIGD